MAVAKKTAAPTKNTNLETPSTTVAVSEVEFSDRQLGAVDSFQAALQLLADSGVTIETVDDYGSGLAPLDDSNKLVGVPFVILEWVVRDGDHGEYVSVTYVTETGAKGVLNAGNGITDQLEEIALARMEKGNPNPRKGLGCAHGLSRSDGHYDEATGKAIKKGQKALDGSDGKPFTAFYIAGL